MTVWIFGDSFAHLIDNTLMESHNQWEFQIANRLNQPLRCFGDGGTSLDFTYEKFNSVRDEIQENDILIIALTDLDRRWFFRDRPTESCVWAKDKFKNNNNEFEAFKKYALYLNHREIYKTYLIDFLYNVSFLTMEKNLHTIILPCFSDTFNIIEGKKTNFPLFNIPNNFLFEISNSEFTENFLKLGGMLLLGSQDLRLNHFIKSNHDVLADKLYNNIINKIPLDFTQGFIKNIVDTNNLKDIEFSKKELFNIHLFEYNWNYHKF